VEGVQWKGVQWKGVQRRGTRHVRGCRGAGCQWRVDRRCSSLGSVREHFAQHGDVLELGRETSADHIVRARHDLDAISAQVGVWLVGGEEDRLALWVCAHRPNVSISSSSSSAAATDGDRQRRARGVGVPSPAAVPQ
jgi:hypothetical protein